MKALGERIPKHPLKCLKTYLKPKLLAVEKNIYYKLKSLSLRISSFSRNIYHIANLWFLRISLSCVTIFGFEGVFPCVIRDLCVKNSSDQKPQNNLDNFSHISHGRGGGGASWNVLLYRWYLSQFKFEEPKEKTLIYNVQLVGLVELVEFGGVGWIC